MGIPLLIVVPEWRPVRNNRRLNNLRDSCEKQVLCESSQQVMSLSRIRPIAGRNSESERPGNQVVCQIMRCVTVTLIRSTFGGHSGKITFTWVKSVCGACLSWGCCYFPRFKELGQPGRPGPFLVGVLAYGTVCSAKSRPGVSRVVAFEFGRAGIWRSLS